MGCIPVVLDVGAGAQGELIELETATTGHRAHAQNVNAQTDTQGTRTETTESPSPRLTRPLGDLKNEGSLGVGCNTTETFELNRMDLRMSVENVRPAARGKEERGERREEQGGIAVN